MPGSRVRGRVVHDRTTETWREIVAQRGGVQPAFEGCAEMVLDTEGALIMLGVGAPVELAALPGDGGVKT